MNTKKVVGTGLLSKLLFFVSPKKQQEPACENKAGEAGYRLLSKEQVEAERSKAYKYVC